MNKIYLTESPYSLKLPSADEMARCDARTIATGITSQALMERAGKAMFDRLATLVSFTEKRNIITILCGPGNNGGDGFVLARHLRNAGVPLQVFFPTYSKLSADCQTQAGLFVKEGGRILSDHSRDTIRKALRNSRVLVDALLGTGQRQAPRGAVEEILSAISEESPELVDSSERLNVAIDVPTGIDADSGEAYNNAFRAHVTLTVELLKRGMVQYPAREFCGDIHALMIGIDCGSPVEFSYYDGARERPLPRRAVDAHKGKFGRVLVLGGSETMPGAPRLAAISALRAGAGLVRVALLSSVDPATQPAELLISRVSSKSHFEESALAELETDLEQADCVVIGPGIGLHADTRSFVTVLCDYCTHNNLPVVVDADALTLLDEHLNDRGAQFPSAVFTPHPGEMARLMRTDVASIQRDRYSAAKDLEARSKAIVVLKGASTVIRARGEGFVNPTGNPFMATAGSGDVLAGAIAALIGQGVPPARATPTAVWAHGKAGDLAHERRHGPIIASDIIEAIPEALSRCYMD
ncbi:MAG: NAD(P)H-hydrate dehydratase [Deltaproteobacteria bacterium]|nr:NAD(P)H-hydrate dehydratase [Deltaproteobacteria bacterium]